MTRAPRHSILYYMTLKSAKRSCLVLLCLLLNIDLLVASDLLALNPQGPRTSGPIPVSLQNEVNAALDRGREWLLAQQNADGSWGTRSNSSTRLTALAALALLHEATAAQRAAALRGCQWLAQTPQPESPYAPAANAAWRALALAVAAPLDATLATPTAASAGATNRIHTPMHAMLLRELGFAFTNDPNARFTMDLPTECLVAMPPPAGTVSSAATNLLTQLASQWPAMLTNFSRADRGGRMQYAWTFARFINRAGGGTLADAQGHITDWRNDVAQALVSTQTFDRHNHGGYWAVINMLGASPHFDPVEVTAFALFTLDEL